MDHNALVNPKNGLIQIFTKQLIDTQCELLQVAFLIAKMRLTNNNNMILIALLINWVGFVAITR